MSNNTSNSRLRCLVVDDEELAVEGISNYISQVEFLTVSSTCQSAVRAADVLRNENIDLMFLDINMPLLSGMDFLESLENPPLTILTTAYSEYALDGYRLNVVDYLLKPIGFQRFFQAACKAQEIFSSRLVPEGRGENAGMFFRQGNIFRKIDPEHILYAEGMQNYVKLHMHDQKIIIHQTMSSLEQMLPPHLFYRIHRSYLINTSHIASVVGNRVFLGETELPVSSQRMENFMKTVVLDKLISK